MNAGKEYVKDMFLDHISLGEIVMQMLYSQLKIEKRPRGDSSYAVPLLLRNIKRGLRCVRQLNAEQPKILAHLACLCKEYMSSFVSTNLP